MKTKLFIAEVSLFILTFYFHQMVNEGSAGPSDTTVGIDVDITGNDFETLGTIDECTQVTSGAIVPIDIWIADVTGLQAWEFTLKYDPAKISVPADDAIDPPEQTDQLFRGGFSASEAPPSTDGLHFLGVGAQFVSSGSGVLARLMLQTEGTGITVLTFSPGLPEARAPLFLSGDDPIDVVITGARIAIDTECTSPTPSPTPTPSPSPTPTPVPTISITPAPTQTGNVPSFTPHITAPPTPTPPPAIPIEDTDCDGRLTDQDVLRVIRAMAGFSDDIDDCPDIGATVQGGRLGDTDCVYGISLGDIFTPLMQLGGVPVDPCV